MRAHTSLAVLALLAVAACSSETKNEEINMDTTAAMAPAEAGPPAGPVTANLEAKDNSGVTGQATATHATDSVTVQVSLSGLQGTASYPAHIHRGTCATGGDVAVALSPVTAANGTGSSTTTVAVAQLGGQGDPLFVQAHDASGKAVSCGDLPGHNAAAGDPNAAPPTSTP
jgi:maltose-binding protein MalE